MLLVPRQLRRAGMTGDVPYYGGRFSPAQAYALSRPAPPPASVTTAVDAVGRTVPSRGPAPSPPPNPPPSPPSSHGDTLASLRHLLDSGVISADEYEQLRARVTA